MAFEKLRQLNRRINTVLGMEKPQARLPEWMQRLIDGDIPDWYKAQLLEATTGQIGQVIDAIQQSPKRVVQMPPANDEARVGRPYAIGVDPAIPGSGGIVAVMSTDGKPIRIGKALYWEMTDGSRIEVAEGDEGLPS